MMEEEVLRIGEHGPLIKLRPPHTVESVRVSAERAQEYQPWLCRTLKWHKPEIIGDLYYGKDTTTGLVALASILSDTEALLRCKRCGAIREQKRFPG